MTKRVGYRQQIDCSDIFDSNDCCADCSNLKRKIYIAPPHIDGVNYDYLIPFDIDTCCKHFHAVKNLSRDWWIDKMHELGLHPIIPHPSGGIDYKEMDRLYAPKPYVAEKIPDDEFAKLMESLKKD